MAVNKYSYNEMTEQLITHIIKCKKNCTTTIIGIDGADCSGKTTLSKVICQKIKGKNSVQIIHFDDYANSLEERQKKGEFSVEAFLYDFFDFDALKVILKPYKEEAYTVPDFIIVEGLFLSNESIISYFDYFVRIEISDNMVLERALMRDVDVIGSKAWVYKHYTEQCIPAQSIYKKQYRPDETANALINICGGECYAIYFKDT